MQYTLRVKQHLPEVRAAAKNSVRSAARAAPVSPIPGTPGRPADPARGLPGETDDSKKALMDERSISVFWFWEEIPPAFRARTGRQSLQVTGWVRRSVTSSRSPSRHSVMGRESPRWYWRRTRSRFWLELISRPPAERM